MRNPSRRNLLALSGAMLLTVALSPANVNRIGRDSLAFEATMTGPAWIDYDGWIAGDSISGRITVITFVDCCQSRYYTGTFVMKQRPLEY